jgi:hypothetical protein
VLTAAIVMLALGLAIWLALGPAGVVILWGGSLLLLALLVLLD